MRPLKSFARGRLLCVLVAALCPIGRINADQPPNDPEQVVDDRLANIEQTLSEIEIEVERRRRLFKAGTKVHREYVEDLTDEYRSTVAALRLARKERLQAQANSLAAEQKRLALSLWHLERIAPLMAEVDDEYYSLTRVLRKLQGDYREQLREDSSLAQRVEEVSRMVKEVEGVRLQRRLDSDRGFYDVRSNESLLETRSRANRKKLQGDEPAAESLQSLRLAMRRIVRLDWADEGFVWNHQHWEELFFAESLAEIADEVDQQLQERGWKLSGNAHRGFLPENAFRAREPSLLLLFQNLRHAAFEQSGGIRRSSIASRQSLQSFSTDKLAAKLSSRGKDNETSLHVYERADAGRNLLVQQSDSRFHLTVSIPGVSLILLQFPGRAELVWVAEENARSVSARAGTFAGIYADHPKLFEEKVFPFLESFGVLMPPTRYDPIVIDRVLAKLSIADTDAAERFELLLQQADSSRFETRTRAMAELESNMDQFVPMIASMIDEQDLSLEVRMRLERVIQTYEKELAGLDSMITRLNLVEDQEYLSNLLERVDVERRRAIQKHLKP